MSARLRHGSREHWLCIAFCWAEDAPLRDHALKQRALREAYRCQGGCGGTFATRAERCEDGEVVHLCDECTVEDTVPPRWVLFSWESIWEQREDKRRLPLLGNPGHTDMHATRNPWPSNCLRGERA